MAGPDIERAEKEGPGNAVAREEENHPERHQNRNAREYAWRRTKPRPGNWSGNDRMGGPPDRKRRESMTTPQTEGRTGLHYIPEFITPQEQEALRERADAAPRRRDLKRRVQHYGYVYHYRTKTVTPEHHLGPLPNWLEPVAERLFSQTGLFTSQPVRTHSWRPAHA